MNTIQNVPYSLFHLIIKITECYKSFNLLLVTELKVDEYNILKEFWCQQKTPKSSMGQIQISAKTITSRTK